MEQYVQSETIWYLGQDVGDVASIGMRLIEFDLGTKTAIGGGLGTVLSGGTASEVSVPAIVVGVETVLHGVGMGIIGASNLVTKKAECSK